MDIQIPIKADLVDTAGKPLTQSLFLEIAYSEHAVYSLKEDHCEWNGKVYPSLKRLYLEMEDPTEYNFSVTYLLGYKHWKRITDNKLIGRHVAEWRDELEMKLRSKAVEALMKSAKSGNYQAAKWFADRGWISRVAGRPSKAEIDRAAKIEGRIQDEYQGDVIRLFGTGSVQ